MTEFSHYQEVTLIEQPEISLGVIWQKFYMQLHLALADYRTRNGICSIGVSFPEYQSERFPLGTKLRIFGTSKEALEEFNLMGWISQLGDYVHITKFPREIPWKGVTSYAIFSRKEVKTNPDRLARRRIKRNPSIPFEEALYHAQKIVKKCHLPYVNMRSLTSKRDFKLFIEKNEVEKRDVQLDFSSYGLSKGSAVPIF